MNHGSRSDSVPSLLLGVFDDMRQLMLQEAQLAKDEILERLAAMKQGVLLFCGAMVVLVLGGISLMFMLVYLLQSTSDLPIWVCHAVVGAALTLLGWRLMKTSRHRLQRSSLMPTKTIETMKETGVWLKKQTESVEM